MIRVILKESGAAGEDPNCSDGRKLHNKKSHPPCKIEKAADISDIESRLPFSDS